MFKSFGILALLVMLTGCGSSPGPLEGSWRSSGAVAPVTFSTGQMEAMGVIQPVEYEVVGNEVTVTLTSGLEKGATTQYTVKSPEVMLSKGQTYRKM
jgi:starvation-inducible outer membrane lipoprotein